MDIFLFTYFFPYKRSEPFVMNEFEFMKKNSHSLNVLSLYGKPEEISPLVSHQISYSGSIFRDISAKREIFLKGLFNRSGFYHHLVDFFGKRLFQEPKKLYWFFISLLITRATISSRDFKIIIEKIRRSKHPVLYFYWGDNLVWTIPYIFSQIKSCKPKIIVRFHNSDLYEEIKHGYAPIRTQVFSLATSLVTISDHGREYLATMYPQFKDKLSVSTLGVSDRGINPVYPHECFTVVSVSNVVAVKRAQLIFMALRAIGKRVQWHHFGDGPLFKDLQTAVLSDCQSLEVRLHGHVTQETLFNFYRTTPVDLFLNVSAKEGIPVSIMEALSFGIPVIATAVGGVPELVNLEVGDLLEVDFQIAELVNKIKKFMELPYGQVLLTRQNARQAFMDKVEATNNYRQFYDHIQNLRVA